ncbi:MAG: glycoside hydrolase family 15 protein [Candidatus Marinimicrobia bacterium]|nr:glycoside hydrolase family 15 protein [Candidatus Neomarinimicrobiota bacterium]
MLDFMPRYKNDRLNYVCPSDVIRYIRLIRGKPVLHFDYEPALAYAKHPTETKPHRDYIKSWSTNGKYESVYLYGNVPQKYILEKKQYTLTGNCYFIISYNQKLLRQNLETINLELQRTKVYWLDWVQRTVRFTHYHEAIIRSALTLKLLSFQKTGAILAAVTTSLPESIGHQRNWDYRFCWIRDASMVITVLTSTGHFNVAERFLRFIIDVIPYKDEKIQIMYGIRGEKRLTERELPWLEGYEGSKPVRIGNAAYHQKQNDIYGVLLEVIYKAFKLFSNDVERAEELWTVARTLVRSVEKNWEKKDRGIWEFRSLNRHFVFSKVLSWVGMDSGVKLAKMLGCRSYEKKWSKTRDAIRKDIMEKGWNPRIGAFTQTYGGTSMDAANLLLASYGFIDAKDPKFVSTVERIREELGRDGLMYRYKDEDDFGEPRSAFTVCSFWMVKALSQIGRQKEAGELLDELLSYSNHLGLFSEDMDFETKRLLGNFPQGYSHLSLIDAAITFTETGVDKNEKILKNIEHIHNVNQVGKPHE